MAAEGFESHLEDILRGARKALQALGVEHALVGGLAVSARAEPRFTRDVDLAVSVAADREAEALIHELGSRGYRILTVLEQETTGRLATVRLQPPESGKQEAILDLLFASSGIEPEIVEAATELEVFPDLKLRVAGIGELLAVKVLARDDKRRPQDLIDIRALLNEATESDLKAARKALALIAERGYDRGRDLLAELERAL